MTNEEYCEAWFEKHRSQLTRGAISELWNEANTGNRIRIEQLRGLCKWASGQLFDAGDINGANEVLRLVGDMEPNEKLKEQKAIERLEKWVEEVFSKGYHPEFKKGLASALHVINDDV